MWNRKLKYRCPSIFNTVNWKQEDKRICEINLKKLLNWKTILDNNAIYSLSLFPYIGLLACRSSLDATHKKKEMSYSINGNPYFFTKNCVYVSYFSISINFWYKILFIYVFIFLKKKQDLLVTIFSCFPVVFYLIFYSLLCTHHIEMQYLSLMLRFINLKSGWFIEKWGC